jgi:hypothetical protein
MAQDRAKMAQHGVRCRHDTPRWRQHGFKLGSRWSPDGPQMAQDARTIDPRWVERDIERQRDRETDRDRQRQTVTDRDRQRQTETDRVTAFLFILLRSWGSLVES